MSIRRSITSLALVACFATACETQDDDLFAADQPTAIQEALDEPRALSFQSHADAGQLVARGLYTDTYGVYTMDLAGGTAEVQRIDGKLMLTKLHVDLEGLDYHLPGGPKLDAMALELERPAPLEATWNDGDVTAHADLELRLDWWIETEDGPVSLTSQEVHALPLDLHVEDDGGALRVDAHFAGQGGVLEVDEVVEVQSIDLAIAGSSG